MDLLDDSGAEYSSYSDSDEEWDPTQPKQTPKTLTWNSENAISRSFYLWHEIARTFLASYKDRQAKSCKPRQRLIKKTDRAWI